MKFRILLVEDEPADVVATQIAFRGLPVEIAAVSTGGQALSYVSQRRPDIILLDLNLPGMDGREVLRTLKRDQRTRRIPIVVLTSSTAEEDILRAYDLNANGYMEKPVTPQKFSDLAKDFGSWWFKQNVFPPR